MRPKEIVVVSGKGGTGKTLVSSLLALGPETKVICDCDVEAANLHLLLKPKEVSSQRVRLGMVARVDADTCKGCGRCWQACRFSAIEERDGRAYVIPELCEGCGVCALVCPASAIEMVEEEIGDVLFGQTEWGEIFYAELLPGRGSSGRLVSELKGRARKRAMALGCRWLLVDGPPGLGCPVISAVSGADVVVLVVEASLSGISDVQRLLPLLRRFDVDILAVANKCGVSEDLDKQLEGWLAEESIPLTVRIPFSPDIARLYGNAVLPKDLVDISPLVGRIAEMG